MSYFYRILEKLATINHAIFFFQTHVGIKNIGAKKILGAKAFNNDSKLALSPKELYLGPDFLKDEYTLINKQLIDSPHYGLMLAIREKKDIRNTEYIRRFNLGELDWRHSRPMPKNFEFYYKKYEDSMKAIIEGSYRPIIVYFQDNRYYIYDGKHRAALCALLGVTINCIVVGNEIANSDLWHYMFCMINNHNDYSKHITFHNSYLKKLENGK